MGEDLTVGHRYHDGDTEHEIVGITDEDAVDVVEYREGEKVGEYTVGAETFRERMSERVE